MSLSEKEWLTIRDVAAILDKSPDTIRTAVLAGKFTTAQKVSRAWCVHRDEVIEIANKTLGGKHGTREGRKASKNPLARHGNNRARPRGSAGS